MNYAQIATAVGQRLGVSVNDPASRDGAAVRSFLTLRHDQLFRAYLWKDSIIEFEVPLNPATVYLPNSNFMPTKARLILPPIFQHVLGVRLGWRGLNVQRPMLYYRANYGAFFDSGFTAEFMSLSSCVWEFDIPLQANFIASSAADSAFAITADVLGPDEVSIIRGNYLPAPVPYSSNFALTDRVDNITKPVTVGTYTLQVVTYGLKIVNASPNTVTFTIIDYTNVNAPVTTTLTLTAGQTSQFYAGLFGSLNYVNQTTADQSTITTAPGGINGLFTYNGVDNPQNYGQHYFWGANPFVIAVLQPGDLSAPKCQRIQLVGKPALQGQNTQNLHVLGKRVTPPFSAEGDVAGVNGLDGILFSLAYYDCKARDESGGSADAMAALNEAVGPQFITKGVAGGFLGKLIEEEVIQAAANSRIIPDQGFGGAEYYAQGGWNTKGSPY